MLAVANAGSCVPMEYKQAPKHVLLVMMIESQTQEIYFLLIIIVCISFSGRVTKIMCCINFCVKYFNRVVVGKNKMEEFCGLNMCIMARR